MIVLERAQETRPETGFPMPGDVMRGAIVAASTYYTDDIVLVLLIEQGPPFFTVAHYHIHGEIPVTGSLQILDRQWNIVPAIRTYEESGGDY